MQPLPFLLQLLFSYATAGIAVAVALAAVAPGAAASVPLLDCVVAAMLWPYFQLLECMST